MAWDSLANLRYNVTGQIVEWFPPEADLIKYGRPTAAATYKVWGGTASRDTTPEFTGTATLDSLSQAFTASSGASQTNRRRLNLNGSTATRLRRYMTEIAGTTQREIITAEAFSSSWLDATNDLKYDYGTSDHLYGIRHVFTVDATFIATIGKINVYGSPTSVYRDVRGYRTFDSSDTLAPPYVVEWAVTLGDSLTHVYNSYFNVCRQPLVPNVTIDHLRKWWPDISQSEWYEQRGHNFSEQRDKGYELVMSELRMNGYDPNMVHEGPMLDDAVELATMTVIASAGLGPVGMDQSAWKRDMDARFEKFMARALTAGLHMWIDTGTMGATTVNPSQQPFFRR